LQRLENLVDPTTTSVYPVPIGTALIEADIASEDEA